MSRCPHVSQIQINPIVALLAGERKITMALCETKNIHDLAILSCHTPRFCGWVMFKKLLNATRFDYFANSSDDPKESSGRPSAYKSAGCEVSEKCSVGCEEFLTSIAPVIESSRWRSHSESDLATTMTMTTQISCNMLEYRHNIMQHNN